MDDCRRLTGPSLVCVIDGVSLDRKLYDIIRNGSLVPSPD